MPSQNPICPPYCPRPRSNSRLLAELDPRPRFEHCCPAQLQRSVESRTGAVRDLLAVARFPSPLIKPDVRIARIRLSDWLHLKALGGGPMWTWRSRRTPSSPKTTASEN